MLSHLLKEQPKSIENNLIYNYSEQSDSSKFYDELFSDNKTKSTKPELFDKVKTESKITQNSIGKIEEVVAFIEKRQLTDSITIEIGGGVFQGRSANAYNRLNNYYPLDISASSIPSPHQVLEDIRTRSICPALLPMLPSFLLKTTP